MGRAPTDRLPRTPVTGPGTGRDKGGIRALGFRIVWAGFGA